MQTISSSSDSFAEQRPSFILNTLFLIGIMALYPLIGALMFYFVNSFQNETISLSHLEGSTMLPLMRLLQVFGQILVLAVPVLLLAGWHTGSKNPFSRRSLAFLGLGMRADLGKIILAVCGIFLLQPILHTITELQDLYVWPAFGAAGSALVHQREMMESFIKALALVRTLPELFFVVFVFAFTPAVCEELFFRGYIQQNYVRSISPLRAVLLTGLVFAFFHMNAANFLPLALLGWYIGYVYSATSSLLVPFIVHFANNFVALLILHITENGNQVKSLVSGTVVHTFWWWLVVGVTLFLFIMVIRRLSVTSSIYSEMIAKKL
ncbi:MAG: CPBP family intramembrane glutamic endopeptidase [Chlorobiaceae bacterium]